MRTSTLLLALPALAAAQQPQIPFLDNVKGWFSKASSSISSAVTSATSSISVPNPVASAAAAAAALNVHRLTLENHKTLLAPGAGTGAPGIETWEVFVTGGNKTCFGLCERAETAWNESVALVAAAPSRAAPSFALLNCDYEDVLCHAWALGPPQVMHIQLPQPLADQSTPATTVRFISVNRTTVTGPTLAALTLQDEYLNTEPYEGIWHPFDGPLAKTQANIALGYIIGYVSLVPSWVFMLLVSFVSRTFMSRRLGPQGGAARAGAAPAAPAQ